MFVLTLLSLFLPTSGDYPYVSYNGMYNNPSNLKWGSTGSPLRQPIRPFYSDYTKEASLEGLPTARNISLRLFQEGVPMEYSQKYTALLPYFMELVHRDMLDLQVTCPPENLDIPISPDDPVYNTSSNRMPMNRVQYLSKSGHWADFPRQQVNSATSWLDGSHIYGISKGWSDILRAGKDGLLGSEENKGRYPSLNMWGVPLAAHLVPRTCTYPKHTELHLFGDRRANESPGLYALHWLFFQEHNSVARELKEKRGSMNDKWLYDKSRYLTIAKLQKVTMDAVNEIAGGEVPPYTHYTPAVDPSVNFLYAGAVQYFFLTMVPDMVFISERNNCSAVDAGVRLCNAYWDGQEIAVKYGPEALLRGLALQPASEIDTHIAHDIRSSYWGPMHWTRRDAISLGIQRGRDLGVPPLNSVLRAYGLPAMGWTDWAAAVSNEDLADLYSLYSSDSEKVELFVGGMLLSTYQGRMTQVFRLILVDQFVSLRNGDRYWWENPYNGLGCTGEEKQEINSTTIGHLLQRNKVNMQDFKSLNVFSLNSVPAECTPEKLDPNNYELKQCGGEVMLHYDYNSTPYAIPLLAPTFLIFSCLLLLIVRSYVKKKIHGTRSKSQQDDKEGISPGTWGTITELQSRVGDRELDIIIDPINKTITTKSKGKKVRSIDWARLSNVPVITPGEKHSLLLICVPKEHDLLLRFSTHEGKGYFLEELLRFNTSCGVTTTTRNAKEKHMLKMAKTEERRQKVVESFLRSIFSEMIHLENNGNTKTKSSNMEDEINGLTLKGVHQNVLDCELTREEFASSLGLRPDQEFVEKVFPLVDRDNSGSISFQEFLSFMVVYSTGSSTDKLKLIFNMYDYDRSGTLCMDEIKRMIKSMLEMVSASIEPNELDSLISSLFKQAGVERKTELTFEEFQNVMSRYSKDLEDAKLSVNKGETLTKQNKKNIFTALSPKNRGREVKRYIENNRLEIFYSVLFFLIVGVLFAERFITYTKYKHHTGFPQLLGYSLSLTRGSAAVLMFIFPLFLVLMCKNTLTHLRGTFLKRYMPLDANRAAHIHLGVVSIFFILIHVVGHGYNFYMLSTLSPAHLRCLMPRTWLEGTGVATVTGLLFGTITGITGLLLVTLLLIMFIFASEQGRRYLYPWFWNTHHLYPLVLGLIVLHGTARLLQEPSFHYYLMGPAVLFVLDKLISISRKKRDIPLIEANVLPSEVTNLVFKRPLDFNYLAGQYVKIALANSGTGRDEYHPFTLTSAPHEDFLSVHIRTCKGWTKILRDLIIKNEKRPERNPHLYIDGPFGEAHQDYSSYEVVILVGGGIGVTPFASILKDLVYKSSSTKSSLTKVKKVYFLWSTRTQKQFEWLLDIISKCEKEDKKDLLDTHIFITRFYEKSDLRTTMLYICERQFQRISNRSLFTGLKAVTHFGRPDFASIFDHLALAHQEVKKFGVFVCGPGSMSESVKAACRKITGKQSFLAYAENF